ncbi:MAG: uncharacterized protein A8A55_3356, partial [Amphiamblys sp. WSBS2006]
LETGAKDNLRILLDEPETCEGETQEKELKELCSGCNSQAEETVAHIGWECPGWKNDKKNADMMVETTSRERNEWRANSLHYFLSTGDIYEKEKRHVWSSSRESSQRAKPGPCQLQDSRRGRPFIDGLGI